MKSHPDTLKANELNQIDKKITNIHSKVIDVMRTQNYQMVREEEFTTKQISNSKILMYLTAIQILLIICFTMWQVSSIKNLLKNFCI